MSGNLRVVLEHVDESGRLVSRNVVKDYHVMKPSHIDEIGLNHLQQLSLIQKVSDQLVSLQSFYINEYKECPKCGSKVEKTGKHVSKLNAIGTEHEVVLQKYRCRKCGWTSSDSLKSLFGSNSHTDLLKLQAELGGLHSFRKSVQILEIISGNKKRKVNNKETIKNVTNAVGSIIEDYNKSEVTDKIIPYKAEKLIVQIDAAHIKINQKGKKSFEALTSTIYDPKDIKKVSKGKNIITRKTCIASAKDDNNQSIKVMLVNGAKRHGMNIDTKVVALTDGAANCKTVAQSLKNHCGELEQVLDWFHIAKKFQNIIVAVDEDSVNFLEKAKWKLWHGKSKESIAKLKELLVKGIDKKIETRIKKLIAYLQNNIDILTNYEKKNEAGDIYTSSIAESTVEAMINSRYRQTQKMQWSKESSHKSLQVRAAQYSNILGKLWDLIWPKLLVPKVV
jgi:transposase-like protein/nuclear transport factor 2 (NTF2) superfamily protein